MQSFLLSISSTGHVNVLDATCFALLSHHHGYPPMGTHVEGMNQDARILIFIRPEFTFCSTVPEVPAGWCWVEHQHQQDNESIVNEAATQR